MPLLWVFTSWFSAFMANAVEWWVYGHPWDFFFLYTLFHLFFVCISTLWGPRKFWQS
jgi:hypothetical protein